MFPNGNIVLIFTRKRLEYSRTVMFMDGDEGYEIHSTGHRQAGSRDPQRAWRDAKGARPDLRHGAAIHHRTRKRERDRRNRQGFDDPPDTRDSTDIIPAAGDKARTGQWHACSMS